MQLRIGELAAATGVSTRSLRYYEGQGLIGSCRQAAGWRDFDAAMIDRVVLIQHLLAAGLCTATIQELLPCLEAPASQRTGQLELTLAEEVGRLERKRRDIDRELELLRALQHDLERSNAESAGAVDGLSPGSRCRAGLSEPTPPPGAVAPV